jgi:hypothetical protein
MNKTLPLAIALALAGVGAVQAQDTPNASDSQDQMQVIQSGTATSPSQTTMFQSGASQVEVTSSMPEPPTYGPKPAFKDLDTNGDGVISQEEAAAYPLLANDFLYASHGGRVITRAQYERWATHQ